MLNGTTCDCGHSYAVGYPDDEAWHAVVHRNYLIGPEVSAICRLPAIATKHSLKLVRTDTVGHDEMIHSEVGKVVKEAHFCTPEYPFGYYGPETAGDHRMFMLTSDTRTAAMVFITFGDRFWHLSWLPSGKVELRDTNALCIRSPKIARIWVAAEYRRRGLAKWLIEEISLHMGVEIADFGWELPLTAPCRALVRSLCPESFLGCGDCQAVLGTINFEEMELSQNATEK